jgi:hypothetical protein
MEMKRKKKAITPWMLRQRGIMKPRSVAFQSSGKGPNITVLAEYHERSKSLQVDESLHLELNRLFGIEVRESPYPRGVVEISKERQAVLNTIAQPWAGDRHHGMSTFNHKELRRRGKWYRLGVYFFMNKAVFIEISGDVIRRTRLFPGLEKALRHYRLCGNGINEVDWIAEIRRT